MLINFPEKFGYSTILSENRNFLGRNVPKIEMFQNLPRKYTFCLLFIHLFAYFYTNPLRTFHPPAFRPYLQAFSLSRGIQLFRGVRFWKMEFPRRDRASLRGIFLPLKFWQENSGATTPIFQLQGAERRRPARMNFRENAPLESKNSVVLFDIL